jgi:hypothetical protein
LVGRIFESVTGGSQDLSLADTVAIEIAGQSARKSFAPRELGFALLAPEEAKQSQ